MKMLKLCKVCGQYKEESEFPKHSPGRLRSTCKECWNRISVSQSYFNMSFGFVC